MKKKVEVYEFADNRLVKVHKQEVKEEKNRA